MFQHRRVLLWLATVTLFLLGWVAPAGAVATVGGQVVTVPPGKIQGPLLVAGKDVMIAANVQGDVLAAGQTVTVDGNIDGDLLVAAQTLRVTGNVTGNIRCLSNHLEIAGLVGHSLTALGQEIQLLPGATVKRDALLLVQEADLGGTVGGQVLGYGQHVILNGPVGGDVRFWSVTHLFLGPTARLGGNVDYTSPARASVDRGAHISGTTTWHHAPLQRSTSHRGIGWWAIILSLASGSLLWGAVSLILPGAWSGLAETLQRFPWPSLGWGLLLIVGLPLVGLLLMITIIGLPLSLTLLAAYLALLYAGKLIVADAASRLLIHHFGWPKGGHRFLAFLAALAVLVLLTKIPVLGFVLNLGAASLALGGVALTIYHRRPTPTPPPPGE